MRLREKMTIIGLLLAAGQVVGLNTGPAPSAAPMPILGKPATVNPYAGMQERERVFEFAQKPEVKKVGEKWVITFASKAACDATVAIVDKDGKIVRHLASGVLGKNAPYPFQQNSLSQKIEWDGLDDAGRGLPSNSSAVAASAKGEALREGGCKVSVGIGLQAKFERNLLGSPYDMGVRGTEYWTSTDADGKLYVVTTAAKQGAILGRVFEKDGAYVRTFWPPPAAELEKMLDIMNHWRIKGQLVATVWGDKALVSDSGPFTDKVEELVDRAGGGKPEKKPLPDVLAKQQPAVPKVGGPQGADSLWVVVVGPCAGTRLAADRQREELYVGANRASLFRLSAKTGEMDPAWKPIGPGLSDCFVGPDGLLYIRLGAFGYGQWIVRVDHDGNPVSFNGDSYDLWEHAKEKKFPETAEKGYGTDVPGAFKGKTIKALWTGLAMHSNTHDRGLYVSPRGCIVAQMQSVCKDYAAKHGFESAWRYGTCEVWDSQGKLLTANAVGPTINGRGTAMDRDGNIYSTMGSGTLPTGQKALDGIADAAVGLRPWGCGGTLVKFRGLGDGKFPLNTGESAVKLGNKGEVRPGALWAYAGITDQTGDCMCHNVSHDMDYFARHWIPANHLGSVMVIDSNGNRLARLGCYGNVDDTDADVKAGKDGLRFVWPRAVAVSDTALFVTDERNHRILKAALKYAAEETVPLP